MPDSEVPVSTIRPNGIGDMGNIGGISNTDHENTSTNAQVKHASSATRSTSNLSGAAYTAPDEKHSKKRKLRYAAIASQPLTSKLAQILNGVVASRRNHYFASIWPDDNLSTILDSLDWPCVSLMSNRSGREGQLTSTIAIQTVHFLQNYIRKKLSADSSGDNISVLQQLNNLNPSIDSFASELANNFNSQIRLTDPAAFLDEESRMNEIDADSATIISNDYAQISAASSNGYINIILPESLESRLLNNSGLGHNENSFVVERDDNTVRIDNNDPTSLFSFMSIGTLRSVFREKFGCPRQGSLVPAARASFTLGAHLAECMLEGLHEYSHCWLIFYFHNNSNTEIKNKIRPPKLDGARTGTLSTRSPHHPNAIGLSLARIDRIVGRTVYLSGIDLVNETPILDLKPYHPSDMMKDANFAEFVENAIQYPLQVTFTEAARNQLNVFAPKCAFYQSADELITVLGQCIGADPRSVHSRKHHKIIADSSESINVEEEMRAKSENQKCVERTSMYGIAFDRLNVSFRMASPNVAQVFHIEYFSDSQVRPRLRTTEWYTRMQQIWHNQISTPT